MVSSLKTRETKFFFTFLTEMVASLKTRDTNKKVTYLD